MQVILTQDVKSLGKAGTLVNVNDSYARNYIIPRKLGVAASAANLNNLKLKNANDAKIEAAKLANADSFIRKLPNGYNTEIKGDGGSLSQGQRQLLSIARAAIADPPALILDEATSSIDTRTEKLVQAGMDEIMKGRTTFVIAHRLTTIQNAETIFVLTENGIEESGSHAELISRDSIYSRLYNMYTL